MPSHNTVSHLDKSKNLLLINRDLFDQLPRHEKQRIWNTDQILIEVTTTQPDYFA
jgi:hypothetical protein